MSSSWMTMSLETQKTRNYLLNLRPVALARLNLQTKSKMTVNSMKSSLKWCLMQMSLLMKYVTELTLGMGMDTIYPNK